MSRNKYSYSPNGFFQINLPVYELALTEIKKHINTDKVLDLYAGVGTIGLSVAHDRDLTLVEVDKFAYGELARNIFIEDISEPGKARISAPRPWRRAEATRVPKVYFYSSSNFLKSTLFSLVFGSSGTKRISRGFSYLARYFL